MDKNEKAANKVKIQHVIKALERRNMASYYCEDSQEAVAKALEMIPEGAKVACGGSMTLAEAGLKEALKEGEYDFTDPFSFLDAEKSMEARRQALLSDVFVTSANAVTLDGEIVNIDGTGNRMAAVIFGPKKVIFIVGVNKLVLSEKDAVDRIKNDACSPNCIRLNKKTPCALTGKCGNCLSRGNTVCCHTVTTRFSSIDDRMHVILVNEKLGY
ncbi:MAG: lactate utilization protein [Clostridiales bacterium]|nr:lactate utilization protein [Clostridiales bacterium]